MSKKLVCGIDIGSSAIKVAIFQLATKTEKATLLALVSSPAEGITKGYIRNIAAARNSILKAKNKAEKIAGTKITHARIGISTFGMKSQTIKTTVDNLLLYPSGAATFGVLNTVGSSGTGNITIGNSVGPSYPTSVILNGAVTTKDGGGVTITSTGAITQNANISASGLNATADSDGTGGAGYTMASGTSISTGVSNISITAGTDSMAGGLDPDDIALGSLNGASDPDADGIIITTYNGAITDNTSGAEGNYNAISASGLV